MIKFFRQIRQQLLTENRFRKYLIYAIGEIVLVVIGILIALQINNWNEGRITENIRQQYYQQLLEDFEFNKIYIKERASIIDSSLKKLIAYKETFNRPDIPLMEIYGNLGNLNWNFHMVQFQSNTVTTLQNTGDIKLIPPDIRNKLISLNKYQEQTESSSFTNNDDGLELTNYAQRFYGSADFFGRIQNQRKMLEYVTKEDNMIQSLMVFEGAIDKKAFSEKLSLKQFEKILSDMDELTSLINKELNKE